MRTGLSSSEQPGEGDRRARGEDGGGLLARRRIICPGRARPRPLQARPRRPRRRADRSPRAGRLRRGDQGREGRASGGAELFYERCSGCHSLEVANSYGSKAAGQLAGGERTNGPNFNVRKESRDDVLFAIRNGGFSGAIMPANIVVGEEAEQVADFLARYSGGKSGGQASTAPGHGHGLGLGQASPARAPCSTSRRSGRIRTPPGPRWPGAARRRSRRSTASSSWTTGAGRCCPRWSSCGRRRTPPARRSAGSSGRAATPRRRSRRVKAVGEREKALERRAAARWRRSVDAALAALPNLPAEDAAAEDAVLREVGRGGRVRQGPPGAARRPRRPGGGRARGGLALRLPARGRSCCSSWRSCAGRSSSSAGTASSP